jgi:hypothetical protein
MPAVETPQLSRSGRAAATLADGVRDQAPTENDRKPAVVNKSYVGSAKVVFIRQHLRPEFGKAQHDSTLR